MFRDSMTGNPALAIFAMLMILASLSALAEAGARIGHIPARGARHRLWFHRLTTLLPLPIAGENRCERFAHRQRCAPRIRLPLMNRDRKLAVAPAPRPRSFDVNPKQE